MAVEKVSGDFLSLWDDVKDRYVRDRVLSCAGALAQHDFSVLPVPTISEANRLIVGQVKRSSTVYYWEEATLEELGMLDTLAARGNAVRSVLPMLSSSRLSRRRYLKASDSFITTVGAVTLDGQLVKLEPEGLPVFTNYSRPGQVIVVAGVNKIVDDLEGALDRARDAFVPQCGRRLGIKKRCVAEAHCVECDEPPPECVVSTVITRKPGGIDFLVVLVGEQLGY